MEPVGFCPDDQKPALEDDHIQLVCLNSILLD